MSLGVVWQARAEKDLGRLDAGVQRRVIASVTSFADSERGNIVRLAGLHPPEYRLRVGDWRVRFRIDREAGSLQVLRVLPRDKAYR